MSKHIPFLLLLLASMLGARFAAAQSGPTTRRQSAPARPELSCAIDAAASYLTHGCNADGRFTYRVYLSDRGNGRRVAARYNLLRHAGAIYALTQFQRRSPQPETLGALQRSSRFLKQSALAPVPERMDALAIWSDPSLTGREAPRQAKLGGAGLALVALCSLEGVQAESTPLKTLQQLGRFLLFMQRPDGSFFSKYIPAEGGRSDRWTSLYYPGEAILGLVMLYELDRSPQWLEGAAKGIAYLARVRDRRFPVKADHWALLATARLLRHDRECQRLVSRQTMLVHVIQIGMSMLAMRPELTAESEIFGCFTGDGRTCPTATRLEGLLAMAQLLPPDQDRLRARTVAACYDGVRFLGRTQVQAGGYRGGIPRALGELKIEHPSYAFSFNRRAAEIRIDYVQHALSAMIALEQLEEGTKASLRSAATK